MNAYDKLKQEFNDNPLVVIGVGAAAVTAVSKLIDVVSGVQSRRAYAKLAKSAAKRNKK